MEARSAGVWGFAPIKQGSMLGDSPVTFIFSGFNAAAQRLYGADGLVVVSVFMQMLSINCITIKFLNS